MSFDAQKFITAQQSCMKHVVVELCNGRKVTHWMWFVFPQIQGLGTSLMAKKYAIQNIDEAVAYLQHDELCNQLVSLVNILNNLPPTASAASIFGYPDDMKFKSCMTLFYITTQLHFPQNETFSCFNTALHKYFEGALDEATTAILLPF